MFLDVVAPTPRVAKPASRRESRCLSLGVGLLGLLLLVSGVSAGELHKAAYTDNAARIQALIKSGAPVNEIDSDGMWPLLIACTYGNEQAVSALLKGGADVNVANASGYTALHEASFQGYVKIVGLLIEAGANLDKRDISNYTALNYAEMQNAVSVVRLLKQHGAKD